MIKGEGYYQERCKVKITILFQESGLYTAVAYLWQELESEDSVEGTELLIGTEDYTVLDSGLFLFASTSSYLL